MPAGSEITGSDVNDTRPAVFDLRGHQVMLAARAARAFDVETRELVQNITRNPALFPDRYAFQVTEAELAGLRSLGVIPSAGRGGSRALPWVVTQKGAIRLATVMKSPRAIEAADQFIDLFAEVLNQLHHGRALRLTHTGDLTPTPRDLRRADQLRHRIYDAMDDLLNTVVDRKTKATVTDLLADSSEGIQAHVREWLRSRGLGNAQTEAQTLLILEQVRDLSERRQSALADAELSREGKVLENLGKKIDLVRQMLTLLDQVEPNAVAGLLGSFAQAALPPESPG